MKKSGFGFIAVACMLAVSAFGQNKVVFDNQSGDPALVKVIGPTQTEIDVPNAAKVGTDAAAGRYVIKVRYGTPGNYRYSKGDEFTVTQTATARSETTITLHKVVAGNYDARPISAEEFGKAGASGGPSLSKSNETRVARPPRSSLAGKNPQGDRIEWADGEVWTKVTIKKLNKTTKDGKTSLVLDIDDVPDGQRSGAIERAFSAIRLRGSDSVVESPQKTLPFQQARDKGGVSPLADLLPVATNDAWNDLCACDWLPDWDSRAMQPEQSMKGATKDGTHIYLQTAVTIPLVIVKDGDIVTLVRNTGGNAGVIDGWFTGVNLIIFSHTDHIKGKGSSKK